MQGVDELVGLATSRVLQCELGYDQLVVLVEAVRQPLADIHQERNLTGNRALADST